MRVFLALCIALIFSLSIYTVSADDPPPQIPTPLPREYNQDAINALMEIVEMRYGIGFAAPEEWMATGASEIMWFTDDLHGLLEALDIAAYYLWFYGEASEDQSPAEFFRQHFDRANIVIDRSMNIPGGFTGNTLPMYENEKVVSYVIQLHPVSMGSGYFVPIHELGHVVDGLLNDQPQHDFVDALGGTWADQSWIPGKGYDGNENLFPRATAGASEDFADTFANMLMGRLSPEFIPVRYNFMREHLPGWLENIRALPENTRNTRQ
ncbi:MAG TPA: hypothetical protein VJZ27_07980 [Aggregatilineales bacterium]|nr:hypothetical protein [Aggregatilineales bacterium]